MSRLGRYRRIEIQVGLFALVALVILVFGLLWLRDFRFAKRYHVYKALFTDTGGLVPGDAVMVSGFRKGTVRGMSLLERGVEVELAVEQDVLLHEDAVATIGTKGLLGERYVALDRGAGAGVLPPGSGLRGRLAFGMPELMTGAGELIESARLVSDDLRQVLSTLASATEDAELARGVRDASIAAGEVRRLLEGNRESLQASIASFQHASENVARITGESAPDIEALLGDLRAAGERLESMLARADTVLAKSDRVADRMLGSQGTLGRLVEDPRLYDDLVRVAARTDSLVREIRARPRRFFSLSIF